MSLLGEEEKKFTVHSSLINMKSLKQEIWQKW